MSESSVIPDSTKKFLKQLNRALQRKNLYDIQHLYEYEFNWQTQKFYKTSSWPSAKHVAKIVDDDENCLVLYKQLYYRHLYVRKLASGLHSHFQSFQNYIDLFNIILGLTTQDPEFEIPACWCWDMIDEFVYQFSCFHAFRNRTSELSESDKAALEKNPHAWSAQTVVRFLLCIADKGGVTPGTKSEGFEAPHALFSTMGTYALIGMLRVNCLMGDYEGGIEALGQIDVTGNTNINHSHIQVPAAHASLHYHLAFAYLATRRYTECVKVASKGLIYLQRNKGAIPRTYQQANINKMQEQMYGILALATSLVPQRLNDGLASGVNDRYSKQMDRMRSMDIEAYKEVFVGLCPKFIPMRIPSSGSDIKGQDDEGLQLQLAVFLDEVRALRRVPDIYSYLKMCTTINVERLTSFLGEEEGSLSRLLLYIKHKTRSGSEYGHGGSTVDTKAPEVKRPEGQPLGREARDKARMDPDMQFVVSEDMVHVSEKRREKQHADFFIREIIRYGNVIDEVENSSRGGSSYY